ncbi:hypothetical protein H4219_002277 [Mycoemilia scoparia]|uniref:DUF962 domain-containing protein n=1 Tax=Mycoemilia scoparia TaxID=417184 RepID=A0A9W8A799_9FUNG|nr:hypothetical protein H4219_002277 [Mycoemilia scoparia]
MGIFNLRQQFAFYGEYHNQFVNVLLHITCVPIILWTAMVFLSYTGPLCSVFDSYLSLVPDFLKFGMLESNAATSLLVLFVSYYFILEPIATLLYLPFLYTFLVTATSFAHNNPESLKYALGLHVIAWIAQFVGHGVFEKRAPALLDNILQAVVMAPFFVFLEVLFFIGYRPQLYKDIKADIDSRIASYKESKVKKGN